MPRLVEMYRQKSPSTLPKAVLALLHLAAVLGVACLLFWRRGRSRFRSARPTR